MPVLESPEGATLRPVLYLLHNHESWFMTYLLRNRYVIKNFESWKSGSGDIFDSVTRSSDRYEFENDLSVSEVKNLPDKLPPIDRSKMPASRLEKIYVRREARHTRKGSSSSVRQSVGSRLNWSGVFATCSMILKRIVQDFATEMKFGLENLQTKIKDLSTALKTRLELNKEDVIQAGYPNFSEFVKWRCQRVRVEFNWYPVKRLLVSLTV